jgi:hypothetical protein
VQDIITLEEERLNKAMAGGLSDQILVIFCAKETPFHYEKSIALVVLALGSQAVAIFAGEPIETSKQVVAPSPVPPPGIFRPNEFDLGAFGTYATGVDESAGSRTFSRIVMFV